MQLTAITPLISLTAIASAISLSTRGTTCQEACYIEKPECKDGMVHTMFPSPLILILIIQQPFLKRTDANRANSFRYNLRTAPAGPAALQMYRPALLYVTKSLPPVMTVWYVVPTPRCPLGIKYLLIRTLGSDQER